MSRPIPVYRRTYRGLIRRAKAQADALIYPRFKPGDLVKVVDDLLKIDERITGPSDGYTGEQVRRRMRYKYLVRNSTRGEIVKIRAKDIYVEFKVKDPYFAKKYGLNKPIILLKQMIELIKSKTPKGR